MPKQNRGFATMSPEERSRIASMGGKKAHALGVAHRWTKETAKIAGRKGGLTPRPLQDEQPDTPKHAA